MDEGIRDNARRMRRSVVVVVAGTAVAGAAALLLLGRSNRVPEHAPATPVVRPSAAPPTEAPKPPAEPAPPGPLPSAVPALPSNAPARVSFGVILFTYRGADLAAADARPKVEALRIATEALGEARRDFAAAVVRGDRGSTADAGSIPRGVLEPAVEYALFTLEKGQVYDAPLDTPRGYWLVRRRE